MVDEVKIEPLTKKVTKTAKKPAAAKAGKVAKKPAKKTAAKRGAAAKKTAKRAAPKKRAKAKRAGKNRVSVFEDVGPAPRQTERPT